MVYTTPRRAKALLLFPKNYFNAIIVIHQHSEPQILTLKTIIVKFAMLQQHCLVDILELSADFMSEMG